MSVDGRVVCIVGPTASGKTDFAQDVAERIGGEIVSADAMQIYRGMDIGTGKIAPAARRVPHYGLDLVEPGEPYSAALFQRYARDAFARIASHDRTPFLVGGTGFYVRAAVDAYEFPKGEQVDNPVREEYQRYAAEHGSRALWELLHEEDPESAALLHPNETRRIVRAFELRAEGESYARQRQRLAQLPQAIPAVFIGLSVDPALLRERIDARVDAMVEAGLVEEVRGLLDRGLREGITAPQAIGYKEIVAAIDGECSMDDAIEAIKSATHRYAKRQRTWFRKEKRIHWMDADRIDEAPVRKKMVSEAVRIIDAC